MITTSANNTYTNSQPSQVYWNQKKKQQQAQGISQKNTIRNLHIKDSPTSKHTYKQARQGTPKANQIRKHEAASKDRKVK